MFPALPKRRTITRALLLLVLAALVPIVAGTAWLLREHWLQEQEETEEQLRAYATALVHAVDGELDHGRVELETLAHLPLLETENWAEVHALGQRVLVDQPGSILAVTRRDGQMLVNTATKWGEALPNLHSIERAGRLAEWQGKKLPLSSQGLTRTVFETGAAAYSDLYYGFAIDRPTLALAVPVRRGTDIPVALTLSFPPQRLQQLLDGAQVPPGTRVVVVDRRGVVVAANRYASLRLGDSVPASAPRVSGPTGNFRVFGQDGTPLVGGFATSARNGFVVRASVPDATVAAAIGSSFGPWITWTAGALALSLVLAALLGRRLVSDLRALGEAASDLQRLDAYSSEIVEFQGLAAALREGAAAQVARAEHRLLKATLANAPAGIQVTDAAGNPLHENAAYVRLEDLDPGQVRVWEAGSDTSAQPRPLECTELPLKAAVRARCDASLVVQLNLGDSEGRARMLLVSAAPVFDEEGEPIAAIVVQVDITRQMEAEQALREADRQKDQFLATLAHELRNPLAPIRTAGEIVRRKAAEDRVLTQSADIIQRQVTHMARMVDDLLEVSRATFGSLALKLETLDLRGVVSSAVDNARIACIASGLSLAADVPETSVRVKGDATRLTQCVANLLNNAVKFTRRGGSIRVAMRAEGAHAVLEVSDTGIGFPPASAERIFGLFVQEHRSGESHNSGLGIGLALVRRLARLHDGTVSASSAGAGQGSVFEMRLPLHGGADTPIALTEVPESAAVGHLLVVDDNRDAADAMAQVIKLAGWRTAAVYDGDSALAQMAQDAPDVVLLDLDMPGLDGYQVCRAIRQRRLGDPIVVALSGRAQASDRERTAQAGFDAHLAKPAGRQEVLALIEGLRAHRAMDETIGAP